MENRPLSLHTEAVGDIFRVQAAVLASFRDALNRRRFTEIVTSKIARHLTKYLTRLTSEYVIQFERELLTD